MFQGKNKIIFLFVIFVLINVVFYFQRPIEVVEYDVKFEIIDENVIGFDVNGTALTFGRIKAGSSAFRNITFVNDYDFPYEVRIFVSDGISNLIFVDSIPVVEVGEKVSVSVYLVVPENQELGEYFGKMRVKLYRTD